MTIIEVLTVVSPVHRRRQAHRSLNELASVIEINLEVNSRTWLKHVLQASETAVRAQRRAAKATKPIFLALHEAPFQPDTPERVMQLMCELNALERAADAHATLDSAVDRWTNLVVREATTTGVRMGGRTSSYIYVAPGVAPIITKDPIELERMTVVLWQRARNLAEETATELGYQLNAADEQSEYRYARTLEARLSSDGVTGELRHEIQAAIETKPWEQRLFQLRPLSNKLSRAAEAFADLELANDILLDAAEIFDPYFATENGTEVRSSLGLDQASTTAAGVELIKLDRGVEFEISLT